MKKYNTYIDSFKSDYGKQDFKCHTKLLHTENWYSKNVFNFFYHCIF